LDRATGKPEKEGAPVGGPLFGVPYVDAPCDTDEQAPWTTAPVGRLARTSNAARDAEALADCLRTEVDVGPSPRSVLSLILGMLSVVLFCLLYLTVPIDLAAFVLGMLELREINSGAAPRAGRSFAVAGVILSGCALVVKLFILLAFRV
jgi:hypothetical protein